MGSSNEYFNIRWTDDSFYEATGICYYNIDRTLFDVIKSGDEIVIDYIDNGFMSPNDIVSIEYQGTCYLELTDVLDVLEVNDRIMKILNQCL